MSFFDLEDLSDEQPIGEDEKESGNLESRNLDLPDDDSLKESLNHHPLIESRNLDKIQKAGQTVQKSGLKIQKTGLEQGEPQEGAEKPTVDPAFGTLVKLWQSIRGPITSFDAEELGALMQEWADHAEKLPDGHPNKGIQPALAIESALRATALQASRPNLKYARKVLLTFMAEGIPADTANPADAAVPATSSQSAPEPEDSVEYAPMPDDARRKLAALLKKQEITHAATI